MPLAGEDGSVDDPWVHARVTHAIAAEALIHALR